jgi:predicted transcriptional regulator
MRVRTTEIKLGTIEDLKKEVLKEGKGRGGRHVIYVPDTSVLSKILSPRRIELLKTIRENPGMGVGELAKLLKRKQESVSRDIAFLRSWGIIETGFEDRKLVTKTMPGKVVIEI